MTTRHAYSTTDEPLDAASPRREARRPAPRPRRARLLLLAALVGLAGAACSRAGADPSSALQSAAVSAPSSAPSKPPAASEPASPPTKGTAGFQATPAPAITVADCRPGDVTARLIGFGPAMGTMYVAVGITPVHGSCSLPAAPKATAVDAAGSRIAASAAADVAPGSRVAVPSQGLGYRIAVSSWCESTRLQALELVLDPTAGLTVSVALPSDFAVGCSGSATSLTMDGPIEP